MSKLLVDNFGKKTFSKMGFQVWVTLVKFLNDDNIEIFAPELSGDALYQNKLGDLTILEVKTDESLDDSVSFKNHVKKSVRDLTLYNKNTKIKDTYLMHTHFIKFNKVKTINNSPFPSIFGEAKVKYNGKNKPPINVFSDHEKPPIYIKSLIKWDSKLIWKDEFKKELRKYTNKLGLEKGMHHKQTTILFNNIIELVETLMSSEIDFGDTKLSISVKELALKYGISKIQLEDRAKVIIETPKEIERLKKYISSKNVILTENESGKIFEAVEISFTDKETIKNMEILGIKTELIDLYKKFKEELDED